VRLLATVTFNPNQLRSHLLPILAIPEVHEVILVADEPAPALPKLRSAVPSPRARRALGRAGSKLSLCVQLARRLRPDWILSYNIMPHGVNGFLAGRASGTRSMYHCIGGPREWEGGGWSSDNAILGRLPRPVPPVERALLGVARGSTLVGTMGSRGRDRLIAAGLAADRVVVTPPSIDVERYAPAPPEAERPYAVVTVAQLIERKRLADLLGAVARLRRRRPDARAAIVGDGPLGPELRREAARLGIADAVDFLGRRADVESVYRSSRLFALTSRSEGLSVAAAEAMACGLPAIVTDVGDMADLVQEGRNGHLVPVGDVEALADRMAGVLDDPARHAAMAAAAREDAVAHAGVDRVSDLYRRLLVEAARETGAG
jgi:L-malate glycosyltransferase